MLKGQPAPSTVAQIAARTGSTGKYKVATYTINNNFGYTAFYGYVHQQGWAALDKLGQTAQTPGDGDVLGTGRRPGRLRGRGVRVRARPRPDRVSAAERKLMGWEYTKDFTPLIPRGIGITAGAASPDSAKLFMDFVFSNAGQQALCDAGFEATQQHVHARRWLPEHAQGAVRGRAARSTCT